LRGFGSGGFFCGIELILAPETVNREPGAALTLSSKAGDPAVPTDAVLTQPAPERFDRHQVRAVAR
jgi:hypothetical protein